MMVAVRDLEVHAPPAYPSACVLLGAGQGPRAEVGQQKRKLVTSPGASIAHCREPGKLIDLPVR